MTLPDPSDVIAPRDELPYETVSFIRQMMEGAYPEHIVLEYRGLKLLSKYTADDTARMFEVYTPDGEYIESLNLVAFRTPTEVLEALDEIVAYDPADREEWVSR